MYASIRKTVKKKLVEFLFWNFSCKDNTISHIGIHIIIGMFNSNPMIPHYLQLVNYSQRYSQLCLSPLNVYWPAETGTHHVQWAVDF